MKLLVIAGIRSQFIKCAAFQQAVAELNRDAANPISCFYLNAGQHYDEELAGVFLKEFALHFDEELTHLQKDPWPVLGSMISGIGRTISRLVPRPEWVVVFGDANTTVAGAFAASMASSPVVHFEAGTALIDLPAPEIVNSHITSRLASVHFCLNRSAMENLARQGITEHVYVVGDIAYDFTTRYAETVPAGYGSLRCGEYVLMTIHRQENLASDSALRNIICVMTGYQRPVLFVTHPRTRQRIRELGLNIRDNIDVVGSLSYRQMLGALKGAAFLVTDSGGLLREAYHLRKRCLIRLDIDPWCGSSVSNHKLIGSSVDSLIESLTWMESALATPVYHINPEMETPNAVERALTILHDLCR